MATYPPVSTAELDAALGRIAARHRDDPRWSEAGTDARDVLAYLRRRHAALPWTTAGDDVWDELVLSAWVYWDDRRRERELLHRALRYGLSLSDVGRLLGIGTRQGMRDYLDRLDALLEETLRYGDSAARDDHDMAPPTAQGHRARPRPYGLSTSFIGLSRATRDSDVHARRRSRARKQGRPSRRDWLLHHAPRVQSVLRELLEQCARVGILAVESDLDDAATLGDYLAWLTEDLHSDAGGGFAPDTLSTLGLAVGELRHHSALVSLSHNHGLHRAIGDADRLRADYGVLAK